MGSNQSDSPLSFTDLTSIGMLSVALLLLVALREAANPLVIIITIAIVCGIGLAAGALLAEAATFLSGWEDKSTGNCGGTRL